MNQAVADIAIERLALKRADILASAKQADIERWEKRKPKEDLELFEKNRLMEDGVTNRVIGFCFRLLHWVTQL